MVIRETVQLDPIWAFRPNHVHYVLSLVVSYWGEEWGLWVDPPPYPVSAKTSGKDLEVQRCRALRMQALEGVPRPGQYAGLLSSRDETALYAAVLWEAVRDWADGCFSPLAVDQRRALQSYWWFMSLPTVAPPLSEAQWQDVADGRRRKCKVPASVEDPLPVVRLSVSSLWTLRYRDPWVPPVCAGDHVTYLRCCDVLGLDPDVLRKTIHIIPPD